ncbi:hypothetical protein MTO96_026091 [Rhipicephalus appendiculatus]
MFTVTCAALAARRWLNAATAAACRFAERPRWPRRKKRFVEGRVRGGAHVITLAPSDVGRPARKGQGESGARGSLPSKVYLLTVTAGELRCKFVAVAAIKHNGL